MGLNYGRRVIATVVAIWLELALVVGMVGLGVSLVLGCFTDVYGLEHTHGCEKERIPAKSERDRIATIVD